jgi:molecular chaperone Hsp33
VSDGEVEITSDYVRPRNCVRHVGRFWPIRDGLDYHLLQNGHRVEREHLALLRELLVACALHHANKPWNEMTGWTINLVEPLLNVFTTGDTQNGIVCGRVFTEDVKKSDRSRLHAQTTRPGFPVRESIVEIAGLDPLTWAEQFYEKSEQLPARLFRLGGDEYAMVVAHPGWDSRWFEGLTPELVRGIPAAEELGPLERRGYHFGCGCDATIIRRIVRESAVDDWDALFQGEEQLRVVCPRCAAVFYVKRAETD